MYAIGPPAPQNLISIRPASGGFIVSVTLPPEMLLDSVMQPREHLCSTWEAVLEFLATNPCPTIDAIERAVEHLRSRYVGSSVPIQAAF
jgi:hypothetical protein